MGGFLALSEPFDRGAAVEVRRGTLAGAMEDAMGGAIGGALALGSVIGVTAAGVTIRSAIRLLASRVTPLSARAVG